jgi:Tfp pilus assembly protein PilO
MKTRILIFGITAATMLALWYALIYRPNEAKYETLKADLISIREKIDDYNRTMDRLPEFLKTQSELAKFRSELNNKLYATSDILTLLEELHGKAENFGLEITEITPPISELLQLNNASRIPGEPQFLNLSLRLTGDYVNFGRFVSRLEKAPYFRGVRNCQIRSSYDDPGDIHFYLSFKSLLGSIKESA